MGIEMDEEVKRWTARRKSALARKVIQGKTTVRESSRQVDLSPSEVESWIEQARAGMENALKDKPEGIREQYETQCKTLHEAYGEVMLELRARKLGSLAGEEGRDMIRRIQQGMREGGFTVPMTKLCRWFEVPRRTVYRPVKSAPKVQERVAEPIKQLIKADPAFGYRTVAGLLRSNKNTVQRIFEIKGLAGAQACRRASTADRATALGGEGARRAVSDGPLPRLDGP